MERASQVKRRLSAPHKKSLLYFIILFNSYLASPGKGTSLPATAATTTERREGSAESVGEEAPVVGSAGEYNYNSSLNPKVGKQIHLSGQPRINYDNKQFHCLFGDSRILWVDWLDDLEDPLIQNTLWLCRSSRFTQLSGVGQCQPLSPE